MDEQAVAVSGDVSRLRVLVIDDDGFMREVVTTGLNSLGVGRVFAAADGAEGIRQVAQGRPDVVICDLNMPGMDGVEFLRHLAERSFLGGLLIFSAEDDLIRRTAQDLAREHGLNLLGSLSKPVKVEELLEVLSRFQQLESGPVVRTAKRYEKDELRRAIVNNEVVPYFQPQVDTATGLCTGVEALARWVHPEDGLVSPNQFVPLAEQTGLISALTESIFRQSVQAAFRFQGFDPRVRLSVNLSTLALQRTWLPDMLTEQAESYGVPPSRITLEVTESNVIDNLALSLEVLTRLRLRGFGLAIDDFGTGYASMQQLRKIPFTELKIDKSFVHSVDDDGAAAAILESSIALGKRMQLSIVAEGVETETEWDRVVALGCNVVQGWYKAKAMPEEDLIAWLHEYRPAPQTNGQVPAPPPRDERAAVVLVVDDSGFHSAATARILMNLGVEAEVVLSGQAAVERLADGGVDLVLMDIQMPEMDGYEAARRIRDDLGSAVPIVGQSGTVDEAAHGRAEAAGMSALIEKSFELEVLDEVVQRWVAVADAESSPAQDEAVAGEADEPERPALDLTVLAAATGLDAAMLQRLAGQAVDDIAQAAAELRESVDIGDLRKCRALAHRAKSSARAIGADTVQQVLASIEAAANTQPASALQGLVENLERGLADVQAGYARLT